MRFNEYKCLKKILLVSLIFFSLINSVYSIGVGSFVREIKFYPNLNENIEAFIINNVGSDIRVKIDARGGLAEYVTFNDEYVDIPSGGKYFFIFNIKLPESIPPGRNRLDIGATDVTPAVGGGIRAVTSAYKAFWIEAPYPGKYIEASFTAKDVEKDGRAVFYVNVVSKGKEVIDKISGIIEISNQGNKIATLTLDHVVDIKPEESRTLETEWDSTGNLVGEYKAKAVVDYDNKQLTLDANFRIGTLLIEVINYTKEFYKDEINKFDIEIKSFWNTEIEDIYGEVEVGKEKIESLKTNLAPWSTTKITAYLDTSGLDLGEHTANIKVYYEGNVAEETGRIIILPKREKIIEMPSKISSTTILLIVIIVLLITGNIFLVLHFLKNREKGEEVKKK